MIKDDKKVQHFISANILIIQKDEGRIKAFFYSHVPAVLKPLCFRCVCVGYTQEIALRNRSY